MLKQYRIRNYNFKLLLMVLAMAVIGVLAIGSAKESLQQRQLAGAVVGAFLMLVVSLFDYSTILRFYWIFYIAEIILLGLVVIMGHTAGGAQRWINLFGIQFQPSETAKIILILFFAQFIMKHKEEFNTWKYLLLCCLLFAIPILLIYEQPDLSTSVIILFVFCVILFTGGLSYKIVAGVLAVVIPTAVIVLTLILQPDQNIIDEYQQNRILAFLNPSEYSNAEGYQQENSVMAIGSGQLYGKGYKNNLISSVKNANYIAEQETDFIFAVIGEEFGFIGSCTVIFLLLFISLECLLIARRAKDLAGNIIATGVGTLIGVQGFVNIGVATYILPNTGLTLPFISNGLTSLVSSFIGIGFVLNVGLQSTRK